MLRINFSVIFLLILLGGCGKQLPQNSFNTKPVSINTSGNNEYEIINNDPGGVNFDTSGWTTSDNITITGSSKAVKGGRFNYYYPLSPTTLRTEGLESNNVLGSTLKLLLYESLLSYDELTENFIPKLATHWKISDDKKTFTFRINPKARWADGKPVTARDVISTWNLMTSQELLTPYISDLFKNFDKPEAISNLIVKVTAQNDDPRFFNYFASVMEIYPSHILDSLGVKGYMEKYQDEYLIGSGPYLFFKSDYTKNSNLILKRRSDYWAEKEKINTGLNNFDEINILFINDDNLAFEKFKKGEIDLLTVTSSQKWNEKFDFDFYNRGLIQKATVINLHPLDMSGIALNMRKEPFNDIRIRKAFYYLFNRMKFNEKLLYNSNMYLNTLFPGTKYSNLSNPLIGFNPDSAKMLLSEAGWVDKNSEGYLTKNGKILEADLYFYKPLDRYYTLYQEDLKNAGIKINLRETDLMTILNLGNERNFQMIPVTWIGSSNPNPENFLSSATADTKNTSNFPGIRNKFIDSLSERYNKSFSKDEKVSLMQKIDSAAFSEYAYILSWTNPRIRIAYQNKFSFPEWILSPRETYMSALQIWYYDTEKLQKYNEAKDDASKKMEIQNIESKYWVDKEKQSK